MFCTLKANNGVDQPYAFESTPPPFARKRAGKTNKVACTNCRVSKLRCSGEPDCCRRCLSKRFSCEYPSPPWSSSGSSNGSIQNQPVPATAIISAHTTLSEHFSSLGDSLNDFAGLEFPADSADGFKSPMNESLDRHLAHELESLRRNRQQNQLIPDKTPQEAFLFDTDLNSTDFSDLVFDSPVSLDASKSPPTTSASTSKFATQGTNSSWRCTCFQQAMSANEAIEIISWSQRVSRSDVYDVLQQQKAAIVRCEGLLECQECTAQPSYMMMLLSMYRKLSETLVRTSCEPEEVEKNRTEQRKRPRDERYQSWDTAASSSSSQRVGYGISIRERRLDDDDESLVLKSLVTVRAKTLRQNVSRVDEVVSQHNWTVHKSVCRDLLGLIDSTLNA